MTVVILILFGGNDRLRFDISVGQDRRSRAIVEQWSRVNLKTSKAKRWRYQWRKQINFVRGHYRLRFVDSPSVRWTPSYRFGYGGRWRRLGGSCALAIPTVSQLAADHWCKLYDTVDAVSRGDKPIPTHIDMRFPAGARRLPPLPVLAVRP